jgi:OOP family OmpA-OmpF porin
MPKGLRRGAVVAALLAVTALAGCGDDEAFTPEQSMLPCPTDAAKPLTLVVGARANSPRPSLPEEIKTLVRGAAKAGQRVQVVRVDGEPNVAAGGTFKTSAKNDSRRNTELENFITRMTALVTGLVPKKPEADVLGALTEAASVTPEGGTVVLIDSGLPTVGPLSFTDSYMFHAEPADVAGFLKAQNLMPALTGKSVVLVGMGNTAEPQQELDENLRGRVAALWQTVAEQAGAACVHDLRTPSRRAAFETNVPVSTVSPPPPPQFKACGTTVLDSDSVAFIVNTADFRVPEAARQTLQGLADQLTGSTQVLLIGNTSSEGSVEHNRDLSRRRAETIKSALVGLGVDEGKITTRGDGSTGQHHIEDRAPDGTLIPAAAAHNRSVVAELSCQG